MKNPVSARTRIYRLVLNALFVAIYVVFSVFLAFKGKTIEISWASLPILLCAFLFSPADAIAVAICGSFLEQLLSPYGLSATTPLWMLPVVLQAALASIAVYLARRHMRVWKMAVIIVASELLLTVANIAVSYVDAILFDYLEYLAIDIPLRLLNGGLRAVISCVLIPLLLIPLHKALARVRHPKL